MRGDLGAVGSRNDEEAAVPPSWGPHRSAATGMPAADALALLRLIGVQEPGAGESVREG